MNTTEEIKKVFRLAFNEINDRSDDIIDWETAYKLFFETQGESFDKYLDATAINDDKLDSIIKDLNLDEKWDKLKVYLELIKNQGREIGTQLLEIIVLMAK